MCLKISKLLTSYTFLLLGIAGVGVENTMALISLATNTTKESGCLNAYLARELVKLSAVGRRLALLTKIRIDLERSAHGYDVAHYLPF
jgi:hypothetical protein